MRTRMYRLVLALALLVSLFPTTAAFAQTEDSGNEFYGLVDILPGTPGWIGDWAISGHTVHVSAATQIKQEHGPVQLNACVKVKGLPQADGSVDATKIETKEPSKCGTGGSGTVYTQFYGTIETLPGTPGWIGDWMVSGRLVHVDASTRINQEHGAVAVGANVEVKGWSQPDGSVGATKIEVKTNPGGGSSPHVKFNGFVEQLPAGGLLGAWTVSGATVVVNADTRIDQSHGQVALGAYVEVEGGQQPDGSVAATKIEVKTSPGGGGGGTGSAIQFYGIVESFPAGFIGGWAISGRSVNVDANTVINQQHGAVAVGVSVEVNGLLQPDGSVNATKIEVKAAAGGGGDSGYVKFRGVIEAMPVGTLIGDWMVSGRTVHVTAATRINQDHGQAQVGATVEVKGLQLADGSVDATKIEVKR